MDKHLELLKRTFIEKIGIILLVGVLCSLALVFEKNRSSDFMVETGDFWITCLTKITDTEDMNPNFEFNYGQIVGTNSNMNDFLEVTEGNNKFDYNKLYGNWKTLAGLKKVDWLRGHFATYNAHGGSWEFSFLVKENEPKDVAYLDENASAFMRTFIDQSEKTIKLVRPNAKIEILKETIIRPENKVLPKKRILIKYGIIGFVLGVIIASMVFFVRTLGKNRE